MAYDYALVVVLAICDTCISKPSGPLASPIALNTLTGKTECEICGELGQLGQHELLEVLKNLED